MPVEEYKKINAQTVGLKNVELKKNYALVITTNGGLWRYLLGDTIEFTSLRPFKIKVTGRLKHFMNAFGEEVIVDNTDKAIAIASEKTHAVVKDYTAAPVFFTEKNNGAHEWLIEFEKMPDDLHSLKENTFNQWLKNKGKLGGQHKVPRLSNDRKMIEEILLIPQK